MYLTKADKKKEEPFKAGFVLLAMFCFLRPILILNIDFVIFGISLLEIFAVMISYLLLIAVFLNAKKIDLDLISIFIFIFCIYCSLSLLWGSQLRTLMQVVLPFTVFFSIRIFVTTESQINLLLSILIIGYLIPILGSFLQIIQGSSILHVESLTGIERHAGLYSSIRQFSNAMFFFSVFCLFKIIFFPFDKTYFLYSLIFLIFVSVFCIWKSYTRSILIGLYLLWGASFIGIGKKYFFLFSLLLIIFAGLYHSELEEIFLKKGEFEIATASSGRSSIWEHNINLFWSSYSFTEKILGRGLGVGSAGVYGQDWEIWSSHNDYLHLLMHLGGFGLVIYFCIHVAILIMVFRGNFQKKKKIFLSGYILSIIFINFSTGIITYQLPTAQLFWMSVGFIYFFRKKPSLSVSQFRKELIGHRSKSGLKI